jgi:hypothetical protein
MSIGGDREGVMGEALTWKARGEADRRRGPSPQSVDLSS